MALATLLKTLVRLVPISRTAVTTTAAISATIRPYSTAVAPDQDWLAAAASPVPARPAATAASTLS